MRRVSYAVRSVPMLSFALWLAACGDTTVPCTVEHDPDDTLVTRVRWETPKTGASELSYAWDEADGTVTAEDDGTSHVATVLGIPPLAEVAFTASTTDGKRTWKCDGDFRTSNLPVGTPEVTITVANTDRMSPERYVVGSLIGATDSPILVLDRQGRYLWHRGEDVDHMVMMAAPAVGGGILNQRHTRALGLREGELYFHDLKGEHDGGQPVTDMHHPFRELPDGTILYVALDVRDAEVDGRTQPVVGDRVMELSPDGTERTLFSTWDHLQLDDAIVHHPDFFPEGLDWTHGNALFWNEATDTVLFSMAFVRTVVEFDRATGTILRSFSTDNVDWTLEGDDYHVAEGEPFKHQHDAHFDADGNFVVFATQNFTTDTGAHVYRIDESDHTLHEIWSYVPDPGVSNWALGQVQELQNGNRLVAFQFAGLLQEVAPDREVVWEAHTPFGTAFGQVYLVDDLP